MVPGRRRPRLERTSDTPKPIRGAALALAAMEVPACDAAHVWHVQLDCTPQDLQRIALVLSREERARADRFRFERHRRRFIVRRAALRSILGAYGGVAPGDVAYRPGPWGKLELHEMGACSVSFNSSHSEDRALIAVTTEHRIGVDIERVRELPEQYDIEHRFFSECEQEELARLRGTERLLGFFLCWTRKEALVKAMGLGLQVPLDSLDVAAVPGEPPAVLRVGLDGDAGQNWSMVQPDAPPGFVAALAVDHPVRDIARLEWDRPGRPHENPAVAPGSALGRISRGAGAGHHHL